MKNLGQQEDQQLCVKGDIKPKQFESQSNKQQEVKQSSLISQKYCRLLSFQCLLKVIIVLFTVSILVILTLIFNEKSQNALLTNQKQNLFTSKQSNSHKKLNQKLNDLDKIKNIVQKQQGNSKQQNQKFLSKYQSIFDGKALSIPQNQESSQVQLEERQYDKGIQMIYAKKNPRITYLGRNCQRAKFGGLVYFSKWPECPAIIQPYKINDQDLSEIKNGNISTRALVMARKYSSLGLNQPSIQLIEQQKQYYGKRYAGFHNLNSQLPLCIVILSYNNVANQRYKPALDTVMRQQYQNYHVVYVDDASSDGTANKAKRYVKQKAKNPQKINIFINKRRRNYLENFYLYALQHCQQHDIVVFSPDGDDAIAGTQYFKLVNYYFQVYDVWISWGSFIYTDNGDLYAAKDIQQSNIQSGNLKCCLWQYFHHPILFYRKTLSMVKPWSFIDLKLGNFYQSNGDNAIMLSQATMSRYHMKYIPQPVYLYNRGTQYQTSKFIEQSESIRRIQQIRDKQQYQQINCLWQLPDGSCPNASEYIISFEKKKNLTQDQQHKQVQNKEIRAYNMYPMKIPQFVKNITEQDTENLNKFSIDKQSLIIAKEYLSIGLQEPSQELRRRQRQYYTQKYDFSLARKQFPICVFITGYNTGQNDRYKLSLNSILRQQYANYRIVYVDDNSNDGSDTLVQQFIREKSVFKQVHIVVHQRIRRNATANHYFYAKEHCKQYQIQIIIDGNDALIGTQVFKLYNYFYQKKGVWATYAAFLTTETSKVYVFNPLQQQNKYSQGDYYEAHPFSFYNKLMIEVQPLSLINKQKYFYWANCNLAITRRIGEKAGIQKLGFIPQIVYMKLQNHRYSDQKLFSFAEIKKNIEMIWTRIYSPMQNLFQQDGHPIDPRSYILKLLN